MANVRMGHLCAHAWGHGCPSCLPLRLLYERIKPLRLLVAAEAGALSTAEVCADEACAVEAMLMAARAGAPCSEQRR